MEYTIFDLETAPQDEAKLREFYTAPADEDLKIGNASKPETVARKLEEARAKHWEDYKEKAALRSTTGMVVACSMRTIKVRNGRPDETESEVLILRDEELPASLPIQTGRFASEAQLLTEIRSRLFATLQRSGHVIGYNTHEFDLPFLFQRMMFNQLQPQFNLFRRGRYWENQLIDLREHVALGVRDFKSGGLAGLGKLLGCKARKEQGAGKFFHQLLKEAPGQAIDYCLTELDLTEEVARKTGVIFSPNA